MKIACVIPHYDHTATVFDVAAGAKRQLDDVRVVDDGSTDLPEEFASRLETLGVALIRHERNLGKGAALLTAARALHSDGVTHMIVIDADGQHDPADLPRFVAEIEKHPDSVVVGCRDFEHAANVPGSSRFGRGFSNFWCRLETGVKCADTQSGFRAYPVAGLTELNFRCRRYNFEIEALVKLLWAGYELREIPIPVFYDVPGKRISHFRPWKDNLRLSLLHSCLVTRQLLPIPHKRLVAAPKRGYDWKELLHPLDFLRRLLRENADPAGLAASAAVGTFFAVLPLVGVHMAVILYVCIRFKLNKVMALAIQNLFMPPLSPFLCIEVGHLLRHGEWWTEFTMQTCLGEIHHRLYEWLLGSLILAPLFAAAAWLAVYSAASFIRLRKERRTGAENATTLSASRGSRFGIGFFRLLLKCGGFGIAVYFSRIVAWFYARFDRRAFAVSEEYLKLRFPEDAENRRKLRKHFHKLLCELAKMLLVSYRMGTGKGLPLEEEGTEHIPPPGGGVVVVFAHIDCWQAAMELMNRKSDRKINIMARPDRNGNFDKFLALHDRRDFGVISTDGFSGGLIEASAALERGEVVIVMGDRPVPGTADLEVPYLGGKIKIPLSPWMLAARNEVPAIPVFAELKEKPRRIVISYRPPIVFAAAAGRRVRPEELREGAEKYARELEAAAMRSPYRIFRFGDEPAAEKTE